MISARGPNIVVSELCALLLTLTRLNNSSPSLDTVDRQSAVIDAMLAYTLRSGL